VVRTVTMKARSQLPVTLLGLLSVILPEISVVARSEVTPQTDLPGLIACRADVADYGGLATTVASPDGEKAFGWKLIQQPNPYLKEYELRQPISVFGHSTRRIVFASSGIMAVLDRVDPKALAAKLNLTSAGSPSKIMFARTIKEQKDELGNLVIRLNVSVVDSHPGKVLAGCEYRFDVN
jgi:hypothetical protein